MASVRVPPAPGAVLPCSAQRPVRARQGIPRTSATPEPRVPSSRAKSKPQAPPRERAVAAGSATPTYGESIPVSEQDSASTSEPPPRTPQLQAAAPAVEHLHGEIAAIATAEGGDCEAQSEVLQAMAEDLERRLREQNHLFWESARSKDDTLQTLREECRAVAMQISHTEAVAARSGGLLELQSSQSEEKEREMVRDDLQAARRKVLLQIQSHSAEIEELSTSICAARSCFAEVEVSAGQEEGEAEAAMRRVENLREEARSTTAHASELAASLKQHEASKQVAGRSENELQAASEDLESKLRCAQQRLKDLEQDGKGQGLSWQHRLQSLRQGASEAAQQAAASFQEASSELATWQRRAAAAKEAVDCPTVGREQQLVALQQQLQAAEDSMCSDSRAASELQRLHGRLLEARRDEAASAEELREVRAEQEACWQSMKAQALKAGIATRETDAVRIQARDAKERAEIVDGKAMRLQEELSVLRKREQEELQALEKRCRLVQESEEARLEKASKELGAVLAREEVASQSASAATEQVRARAIAEARAAQLAEAELQREVDSLTEAAMTVRDRLTAARDERQRTLASHLSEHSATLRSIAALSRDLVEQQMAFEAEEAAAQGMKEEAKASRKQMAIELRTESSSCMNWREKAAKNQAALQELQDQDRKQQEVHQQHLRELAEAKEEAGRHGRAATEMRAELVLRSQEAAGGVRPAQRDLDHAQEELWVAKNRLEQLQQTHSIFERHLQESQAHQSALEGELHEAVSQLSELRREETTWVQRRQPPPSPALLSEALQGMKDLQQGVQQQQLHASAADRFLAMPPPGQSATWDSADIAKASPPSAWRSRSIGALGLASAGMVAAGGAVCASSGVRSQGSSRSGRPPAHTGAARAHSWDMRISPLSGQPGSDGGSEEGLAPTRMTTSASDGVSMDAVRTAARPPGMFVPVPMRRSPPPLPPLPVGSLPCSPGGAGGGGSSHSAGLGGSSKTPLAALDANCGPAILRKASLVSTSP